MLCVVSTSEKLLVNEAGDTASTTRVPSAKSTVMSGRASLRLQRSGSLNPKLYRSSLWELKGASRHGSGLMYLPMDGS
jgi:hypothetical protein